MGAKITDWYLRNFVHLALYLLLQVLGVHHDEIERHLSLFQYLHTMIASLQLNASAYGAKNRMAIFDLRSVFQGIHTRLALVELASEIFTRHHVKKVMNHISSRFKD